jgi:hypothetical protein
MNMKKLIMLLAISIFIQLGKAEGNLLSSETHCKNGTDPYCMSCGNVDEVIGCHLCAISFIDEETMVCKVPPSEIDHCGTYDSKTQKCSDCIKGYFLTSDGFCAKHDLKGCLDPLDSTKCRECESFMIDENHQCDMTKNCSITGCSTCKMENDKEVCIKCKKEYILSYFDKDSSPNTCVVANSDNEGCLMMKDGICIGCKFGYYMKSKFGEKANCQRSPAYDSEFVVNWIISFALLSLIIKA